MRTGQIVITALLFLSCLMPAYSQVCRRDYIEGFFNEYKFAKQLLGEQLTNDPNKVKVYLTTKDGLVYAQSNFLTNGFDKPTKLAFPVDQLDNIEVAFQNILGKDETRSLLSKSAYDGALQKSTFFVDESFLQSTTANKFDFGKIKKIKVIRDKKVIGTAKRPSNSSKAWFYEIDKGIYVPSSNPAARLLIKKLAARPFVKADFKVLSLTSDNLATARAYESLPSSAKLKFAWTSVADLKVGATKQMLRKALESSRGKTVCIVGHIDAKRAAFVTPNPGGEPFVVRISELDTLAKELDIDFWYLGCSSAEHAGKTGTVDILQTDVALRNIADALESPNYLAVVKKVVGKDDVSLVVTEEIVDAAGRRYKVRVKRSKTLVIVASTVAVAAGATLIIYESQDR